MIIIVVCSRTRQPRVRRNNAQEIKDIVHRYTQIPANLDPLACR
jgi:hypothetical protein